MLSLVRFPEVEEADAEDGAAALVAGIRVFGTEFLVLSLLTGEELVKFTGGYGTEGRVVVLAGV